MPVNNEQPKRRQLLSVPEFASEIRVTVACVRRWVLERRISYTKLGRLVRIPSSELDRIISNGTVPAREVRDGR